MQNELRVEDYAFVKTLAREIVDRAIEREWQDVIEHFDKQVGRYYKAATKPLTDQERAEDRLRRIDSHIKMHP